MNPSTGGGRYAQAPAPEQSHFNQGGTLDWVGLSKTSVSFTVDVLGRFMAAGVSPLTIVVGQEVARRLRLSKVGHEHIQDALQRLQSYRGFGKALWFGFGLRSLPRTLGTTDEGRSLVALCAALGETFHEDIAASVIHHLVANFNAPSGLTPSLEEWQAVIKACSGVLASTKFPNLVEGLMRLVPQRYNLVKALEVQESGKVPRTACPLPSDIAAVLTGLSMVTNAQYQSITIEGGIGTGWIAAVAEWLYGLTVTIFDKRDVNIYTTARRPLAAQVLIHLGRDPTRVPSDRALSVISRTYKLNDIVDIMKIMSINELPMYGGRLAWSTCLSDAYGIEFVQLMEQSDIFGRAFGCAGRIFKAITMAEPGVDQLLARCHWNYFAESSGEGFVTTAIDFFPELQPFHREAYKALRFTLLEARITYTKILSYISKICQCALCTRGKGVESSSESLCLLALLETIITLCQTLSAIFPRDAIQPRRNGLEWFYRRSHLSIQKASTHIGSADDLIRRSDFYRIVELSAQGDILQSAMMLFAGRLINTTQNLSAISESGICMYFSTLHGFSIDRELLGRAYILAGHIASHQKPIRYIKDRDTDRSPDFEHGDSGFKVPAYDNMSLEITETATDFALAAVSFSGPDGSYDDARLFGHYDAIKQVLAARGLVYCDHDVQEPPRLRWASTDWLRRSLRILGTLAEYEDYPGIKLNSSVARHRPSEVKLIRTKRNFEILSADSSDIIKTVTIAQLSHFSPTTGTRYCILLDHQCVECCVRSIHTHSLIIPNSFSMQTVPEQTERRGSSTENPAT